MAEVQDALKGLHQGLLPQLDDLEDPALPEQYTAKGYFIGHRPDNLKYTIIRIFSSLLGGGL